MTYSAKFTTVATSIAGLTITGVTIKDLSNMLTDVSMACPLLMPGPSFITNLQPVLPETYGSAGTERLTLKYNITYRYFHCAVSAEQTWGLYDDIVSNVAAIMVVLMTNDKLAGLSDLRINAIPEIPGIVTDPLQNEYYGCDITLSVEQKCEL